MHSGFGALRSHCPMNIEASLPQVGALAMRDQPAVRADVERIVAMWTELLDEHKAAAAVRRLQHRRRLFRAGVHAPQDLRAAGAGVTSPPTSQRVCALPGVKAWIDDALAEQDFLDFEEPYRTSR